MSTNTAQLLAEIPLFSSMDDEERRQLRAIMKERSFQPGQVVMAANDPEASFFIVEQGEMEVWLTDTDGKKVVQVDIFQPVVVPLLNCDQRTQSHSTV
jgi:CRP/FNR family transcriptional regulator, cyclic AMP receptor protein